MMDVFILQALLEDPLTPGNLNGTYSMAAGSGSALIAAFLVYPADMLKTRLIVQNVNPSKSHYRGIVHGFRKVWKAEGFLALYKGLLPTFLGECFRCSRNSQGQVNSLLLYVLSRKHGIFLGLPYSMFCLLSPNQPIWDHVSYTGSMTAIPVSADIWVDCRSTYRSLFWSSVGWVLDKSWSSLSRVLNESRQRVSRDMLVCILTNSCQTQHSTILKQYRDRYVDQQTTKVSADTWK